MKKLDPIEGISSILARNHIIGLDDLASLRSSFTEEDDITFEDFLIEEGIVDKNDLLQALSEYYRVPYLDVVGEFFDHYLVRLVPEDVLLTHLFIPYMRENDNLWVVAAEPDDPHLPVVLGRYQSHHFNFMVGLPQDIRDAIREYYDESITYQPKHISNALMERSAQEVHEPDQLEQDLTRPNLEVAHREFIEDVPLIVEETDDDYESR